MTNNDEIMFWELGETTTPTPATFSLYRPHESMLSRGQKEDITFGFIKCIQTLNIHRHKMQYYWVTYLNPCKQVQNWPDDLSVRQFFVA